MGIMLAFPEFLVGISTTNLFASWINTPRLKELAREDDVPWSLTHTILANMGGIALRFSDVDKEERSTQPSSAANTDCELAVLPNRSKTGGDGPDDSPNEAHIETTESSEFLLKFQRSQEKHLQGLGNIPWKPFDRHLTLAINAPTDTHEVLGSKEVYQARHIAPLHGNIWVLDSKQLALAKEHGIIKTLPNLEENQINDKSKSDGLVRVLALLQVTWLIVQLAVRRIQKIPFSALEVSTLAFSSCAFIIYLSEWSKPKDVGVPFYIGTDAVVSPEAFASIAEAGPISFLQRRHYYMPQSVIHQVFEGRWEKKHIDRLMIFSSILSIMLFGGLHLFAWNIDFPSHVEKLIWRGSALTVAIAPTVSALLVFLESVVFHRTDRYAKWSVTVLCPLYLFARLFILVESYRSLYFLPPEAFISTWASNAPHFG